MRHNTVSRLDHRRSKSWLHLPIAVLVTFALFIQSFSQSNKPDPKAPFLPPAGQFAVGTHEYLLVDQRRDEPFTKDTSDRRHLLVRVWYPAEKVPGKEPAPYVYDVKEFPEKSVYRRGEGIKTNAITDAPLAAGKSRFPVVVYQPGGGTARFVGTFVTEQLASQGYVVVSVDHAGFSETVLYPDGFQFQGDTLLMPKPTGV